MAISSKDFKNIVSQSKVNVRINLSGEMEGLTPKQKKELKIIVGDTLINEIKTSTKKKFSTVGGGAGFEKLSKKYRKIKLAQGKGGQPNLRLKDKMINDIFKKTNVANGVSLNITESLSMKKAENHNHGVTLPKRQFLPTSNGQGFKRSIMKVINSSIREYKKNIVKTKK